MILDIWEKMYNKAKVEYHREQKNGEVEGFFPSWWGEKRYVE